MLDRLLLRQLRKLTAKRADPLLQRTLIQRQLLFAAAFVAAAALPAQMRMRADQTRKLILTHRHLHLQPRLFCPRPLRKDLQDQQGPVAHLSAKRPLHRPQLRRRALMQQDDIMDIQLLQALLQFQQTARSEIRRRIARRQFLSKCFCHAEPTGLRKAAQLLHLRIKIHILLFTDACCDHADLFHAIPSFSLRLSYHTR